jgi:hypothetical protein
VDRERELVTLERLERRRGDSWQGLWLAPLLTIVAQAFLLTVLADERIGWLARAAVLLAALAANLAALWSLLRARAREVQYSEAIADWTAGSDGYHPDIRPAALARPRRKRAPAGSTPDSSEDPAAEDEPDSEDETSVLDATPPPVTPDDEAEEPEDWVSRWDRHVVWWASGEAHAKAYMAWAATLALFLLADVAVLLASV